MDCLTRHITLLAVLSLNFTVSATISAKEYHVAKNGNDLNKGTDESPFLTIQAAANIAQPGDTILVKAGIYREEVKPPRSGTKDKPITYLAATGENVSIRGSEQITGWFRESNLAGLGFAKCTCNGKPDH
jgi:alpha-N-arabinofuranosidase